MVVITERKDGILAISYSRIWQWINAGNEGERGIKEEGKAAGLSIGWLTDTVRVQGHKGLGGKTRSLFCD